MAQMDDKERQVAVAALHETLVQEALEEGASPLRESPIGATPAADADVGDDDYETSDNAAATTTANPIAAASSPAGEAVPGALDRATSAGATDAMYEDGNDSADGASDDDDDACWWCSRSRWFCGSVDC